ncbi:MAG: DUF4102 domain-containing protein [Methylocystaceae bacterium]|nr:DUF4102 domain-containing protein [Methylocystaceae bacterium]
MDLNEANIKLAKVGDILNDDKVKGLSLRIFPIRKSFYLFYRVNGTQRRPKIGDYGSMTLAQARSAAKTILAKAQLGQDPYAEKQKAQKEKTISDLWSEFKVHRVDNRKTGKNYEDLYRLHIEPRFAKKKLSDMNYSNISKMMTEMKNTPVSANHALTVLSMMFGFALDPLEWVSKNPCTKVQRYKEVPRKRYMAGEEAAKIAEILNADKAQYPASVAFIYLLILTGARCGEIKKAKWSMLQGNKIVLKEHKTDRTGDDRVVRLPAAAMDLIETLPRVANGTITGILSPKTYWKSVQKRAGCPDLRLHDLRHSFASAALSAGLSLAQIGELLGHKSAQTTKRYAHLVDECAEAAASSAADQIMSRMKVPLISVGQ